MRVFAALLPPAEALDEVAAAVAAHREQWPGLRWTRRDLQHVTVAFFGESGTDAAGDRVLRRVLPRLQRAAARAGRLELRFGGAGAFPRSARATVLWTDVRGDRDPLVRLAESAAAAGRRAGFPLGEHRTPRPHLTLARTRRPADLGPLIDALAGFEGRPWRPAELHLVSSHLGPEVRYETVWTCPLG